ncbi:hypothetical protein FRC00_006215 [Tulasnella sp. 408]|nr:hypothetical protein FRC00_006215 [Tulasnella sp. 408]
MSHGRVGQSGTSEDDPRNILDPGNHVIERRDSLAVYEDFLCTSTTTILPAELDRSGRVGSQFKEGAPPQTQTKWVLRFDGNSIRVGGNHAIWPPNAPLKLAFYSTGLDGNTAGTFKPVNQKDFPHGAATELNIITSFICTRLQSPCNASQDAVNRCQQVQNSLSGQTGGQAADNWNGQFGINSNYGGQNGGNNGNGQSTTTTTTTTTRAPTTTTTTTPAENRDPNPTTTTTTTTPGSSASGESQGLSSSSSSSATTTTTAAGSDVTDVDGMIKDEHCTLQAILVTVTLPAGSQATGTSSPNVLVPVTGFNALDRPFPVLQFGSFYEF